MGIVKKLEQVCDELVKRPGFPRDSCSLAAKVVYEKTGIPAFAGYVLTNTGPEKHSWNETKDSKIIDLSLYQFDKNLPKIIYEDRENLEHSWGYFIDEEITRKLRKYIENFGENFFGFYSR